MSEHRVLFALKCTLYALTGRNFIRTQAIILMVVLRCCDIVRGILILMGNSTEYISTILHGLPQRWFL